METCFNLGYGGWCAITPPDDISYKYCDFKGVTGLKNQSSSLIMFQVLSARVNKKNNIPSIKSFYLPKSDFSNSAKSSIRVGYGTCNFDGEISFELTNATLKLLTINEEGNYGKMFHPNALFHLQFFDGKNTCTLYNCMWSNFSINCQPGALVTCSLSFQSNNGYNQNLCIINQDLMKEYYFDYNDLLIPYWKTGSPNMVKFQLSFNKSVVPVYLNNCFVTPSYFRPGLIEISLGATYFDQQFSDLNSIVIGSKCITFNVLILQDHGYEMSNLQSQGEKTYQWNAISLTQTMPIFVITDIDNQFNGYGLP